MFVKNWKKSFSYIPCYIDLALQFIYMLVESYE